MDQAIRKARVLIEALGWIRQFRDRYVVIKLGGSALETSESVNSLLTDVIFMEAVGVRPVLVHGGGKSISRAMDEAGIESRFVHGRRFTDEATLEIVVRVLAEEISGSLIDEICRQGGGAKRLSGPGVNCLVADRLTLVGEGGEPLDLGLVGHVIEIDVGMIEQVCDERMIPVVPSVAVDRDGALLNVNADSAAAAVARLLNAEKLVFLSDVPGICRDLDDPESLLSHLDMAACQELKEEGVIEAGMLPKVDAALEALQAGVRKVHIVDGRMPHSVLLEVYSDTGVGTEIVLRSP
ncbi:MAG: acetylglutamate kinase [Planctomycetaceae bacterium]